MFRITAVPSLKSSACALWHLDTNAADDQNVGVAEWNIFFEKRNHPKKGIDRNKVIFADYRKKRLFLRHICFMYCLIMLWFTYKFKYFKCCLQNSVFHQVIELLNGLTGCSARTNSEMCVRWKIHEHIQHHMLFSYNCNYVFFTAHPIAVHTRDSSHICINNSIVISNNSSVLKICPNFKALKSQQTKYSSEKVFISTVKFDKS